MSAIAGRVLIKPQGAYNPSSTYHMLDAVSYNGNSYIAKKTTQGNTPTTDNEFWMLLAAGSAVASINDIGDVIITSPTDGQVLTYDATASKWKNADASGGFLPHLIIIAETGESVVKAVKGQTEIIATETSTGHYECDVPEFGTWTIHAVLDGDDATVNLVVDTVKIYTVDDSHWHADITVTFPHSLGATCSCSKEGTTTLYATESPYTFTVHEAGTYTLTCNYDENDYTETAVISTSGSTTTKVLPVPAIAPTDDINLWLFYGGIDNSQGTYSTLSDILADSTALSALMSSNVASDYLVRNTSWASLITANQSAMTYIGLNNYCANTLIADSVWLNAIANSEYIESVLNVKVPTMTGDTTPSGECFVTSYRSGNEAYRAFDGDMSTFTIQPSDNTNDYNLGYIFNRLVKICVAKIENFSFSYSGSGSRTSSGNIKIQGQVDNAWTDLTDAEYFQNEGYSSISYSATLLFNFVIQSLSYRLNVSNRSGATRCQTPKLQFYGREDV